MITTSQKFGLLILILGFLPTIVLAHPTSYTGATAVMTWNQSFYSDHWIAHTFTPHFALAARASRMEMPEGEFVTYLPQIDFLAKRWNNADSQANIYAYGGAGGATLIDEKGHVELAGVEADAESRSWFILGKWESTWSNLVDRMDSGVLRLGLAPYEAEFNELASWFMIQYQYHPDLVRKQALTPLIRLFYKSVLWEAGVSTDGDWMFNFMFHF